MIAAFLIGLFLIIIILFIFSLIKISSIASEKEREMNYERKNSKTN